MTAVLRMSQDSPMIEKSPARPLNVEPQIQAVMTEQLHLTGLLLRGGGAFFGVLLVLGLVIPAVLLSGTVGPVGGHKDNVSNFTFSPEMSIVMVCVALILPLIVWRDEDPTRRDYLWLMPVSRRAHTLARVIAGWCWAMLATLAYVIVIVLLPLLVHYETGAQQPYHAGFAAWEWLVPFGAVSVTYALASIAAVTTQRPLVWIFGSIAIYAGSIIILLTQGMQHAAAGLLKAWDGAIGLRATVYGVASTSDDRVIPDLSHWAMATALWGGLAIAILWFASSLRRRG
jgi:hypothetical protein